MLQRTGDPANLTSLRAHLELLANIDHNPGASVWVSIAARDERQSPPFLIVLLIGVQMLPPHPGMSWKA